MALALGLAELADGTIEFPVLGRWQPGPLRLIVAPDAAAFQRTGRGSAPTWGMGLAFPRARTVVVRADGPDPRGTFRHELAHLALHDRIQSRVPLWFDEGMAVVAAGELGRLLGLEVNLAVVRGRIPDLRQLDASLRREMAEAETAYALAGSAVLHLLRLQPTGSIDSLLALLDRRVPFDQALLAVSGYDLSAFERSWHRDVRRRYGWLVWFLAAGFWLLMAGLVATAVALRRRRDRPRRAALNEGWTVPEDWEENP